MKNHHQIVWVSALLKNIRQSFSSPKVRSSVLISTTIYNLQQKRQAFIFRIADKCHKQLWHTPACLQKERNGQRNNLSVLFNLWWRHYRFGRSHKTPHWNIIIVVSFFATSAHSRTEFFRFASFLSSLKLLIGFFDKNLHCRKLSDGCRPSSLR